MRRPRPGESPKDNEPDSQWKDERAEFEQHLKDSSKPGSFRRWRNSWGNGWPGEKPETPEQAEATFWLELDLALMRLPFVWNLWKLWEAFRNLTPFRRFRLSAFRAFRSFRRSSSVMSPRLARGCGRILRRQRSCAPCRGRTASLPPPWSASPACRLRPCTPP